MVHPRLTKPREELDNLLTLESQSEEPEHNQTRPQNLQLPRAAAVSCSSPAVTSQSQSAGQNSGLFSFSPLSCNSQQRQHSKEDGATISPSCLCSAGPAHTPTSWLMSAEPDESPHVSRPRLLQHDDDDDDDACDASVGSCSLIPARGNSPPHQQLQQTLEDMSSAEPSAVHKDVHGPFGPHRASSASDILTEGEAQVAVCDVIHS